MFAAIVFSNLFFCCFIVFLWNAALLWERSHIGVLDFRCLILTAHRSKARNSGRVKGPLRCYFVLKSVSCHWPPTEDVKKATWFNGLLLVFLLRFLEEVLWYIWAWKSVVCALTKGTYTFPRLLVLPTSKHEEGTTTTKHLFEQEVEAKWKR